MLSQDGARSGRKEALPASGETQTHLSTTIVQDWASSIISGSNIEESRAKIVKAFQDLPEAIKNQELIRAYSRTIAFASRHNLRATLPVLVATAQQLPEKPKPEQLELLGFAEVAFSGTQESEMGKKLQISVDLAEFGARLGHAEDFNGEDWLASLAMITWHRGVQREMQAKTEARDKNLQYLLELNPTAITLDNITNMYSRTISMIYPNPHNTQTYREDETVYSSLLMLVVDPMLRLRAMNLDASERKQALSHYLDDFNLAIARPSASAGRDLARLYTAFLVIHPHADGNGTMIKTLINYYLAKQLLPRIDWNLVKTDQITRDGLDESFEAYIYEGSKWQLESWFERQIASS